MAIAMTTAKRALTEGVLAFELPEETTKDLTRQIQESFLAQSAQVREPNFTSISPRDLDLRRTTE